jgi:hypothetical protein
VGWAVPGLGDGGVEVGGVLGPGLALGLTLGIGVGEADEPPSAEGTGLGVELGSSAMPT